MKLGDLGIGARLGLGLGVLVSFQILFGLYAIHTSNHLASLTDKLFQHPYTVLKNVMGIRADIIAMHRGMKDVAMSADMSQMEVDIKKGREYEADALWRFDSVLERYLGDRSDVESLKQAFLDWRDIREHVIGHMRADEREAAAEITRGEEADYVAKLDRRIEILAQFTENKGLGFHRMTLEEKSSQIRAMALALTATVILSITIGIMLVRSIVEPLSKTLGLAETIGQGDLTVRLDMDRKDQVGQLASALDVMADSLQQGENELREANASLEMRVSKRTAELESFIYTISHDLRSPLITIAGFLGHLEKDIEQGAQDRVSHYISRIDSAVTKMQRLLDELLLLSRIGRVFNPPVDIELSALAEEAGELVAGSISQRGVTVDIAPDLPVVRGDRQRLLAVYQNLLENAVKFMGDQRNPLVEIGRRTDVGKTVLFVRDNGIGVNPKYSDKIFGLFDKLDSNSDGSGAGLAIVKRTVEVHGGRIWVESKGENKGSRFCFTLSGLPPGSDGTEGG